MSDPAGRTGLVALARRYAAEVGRGFSRAPAEFAAALAVAVAFSYAIEQGEASPRAWVEVAATALLITIVAWTGTQLHALGVWSARTRWLVTVAGAALLGLFGRFALDLERAAEGWRVTLLVLAGLCWAAAVPVFGRSGEDPVTRLRAQDGRLLLRLLAGGLYGAGLFVGLALAVAAVDSLFELKLEGEIYGNVFGWIAFVLVPWVVFSGIDEYVRPLTPPTGAARVVHRITIYLVLPLLALYFAILYAYALRIALTGELPKNLVSPMVLAAGALCLIALLLFDPRPQGGGPARALRLAPVLFLPLAALGTWAIFQRIDQYGWTEFRVLRTVAVAALAALAAAATVQLVRRRAFALHVVPLVLAIVFLLAAAGPWSAPAIARRSQQQRLAAGLEEAGLTGAVPPAQRAHPRTVPAELYDRIQGSAHYLLTHFGTGALPPQLAREVRTTDQGTDFGWLLGLARAPSADARETQFGFGNLPHGVPLETAAGVLYRVEFPTIRAPDRPALPSPITIVQDSLQLRLNVEHELLTAELAPLLALRGSGRGGRGGGASEPARLLLPLTAPDGMRRGELVLLNVGLNFDSAVMKVQHFSGVLLLRPR